MQCRFIIDAAMYNVSKTTRKSTLAPSTPRFKPTWFVPDRGGLSINEHVGKRLSEDMCSKGSPGSGKTHSQCEHHSRFPDCEMRLRKCRLPDCTQVCEQTGNHCQFVTTKQRRDKQIATNEKQIICHHARPKKVQ